MRLVLRFSSIVVVAALLTAGTVVALAPRAEELFTASRAEADEIDLSPLCERSYVYAKDGTLLATLHFEENRSPVTLDKVPDHVVDAILAVEDQEFWSHRGVNLRATVRALLENVEEGGVAQGGSTITQQLVKKSLVGSKQDLDRKSREAFLALRLEEQMSKTEILERYINTVYFGNGAYGVQAASEVYFGIDIGDVDVGQAALLASLIRSPADYDPFEFPEVARERRDLALGQLEVQGLITPDEHTWYGSQPLPDSANRLIPPANDYFVEEVKQQLLDDPRLGQTPAERFDTLFCGGLKIDTTLDLRAQFLAVAARNEIIAPFGDPAVPGTFPMSADPLTGAARFGTVAMASVEPSTGAVRAIVGGPGFEKFKYNLATQASRQPGSSFKIFVMLALLENGFSPNDSVSGSGPCTFNIPGVKEPYKVENFGNSRGGSGTIISQVLRSSNCAFVRLGQIVGLDKVVDVARELGITTPLDPSIFSMPLGSLEVKPIEMAAAVSVIFNDGARNPAYFIERIVDRSGEVLFEHQLETKQVLTEDTSAIAADILRRNIEGGTGTAARLPGRDAGGKTGTAQDFGDAWFVGGTRQLATAVWMGSPVGRVSMRSVGGRSVTGGSYPAAIWGSFMEAYHEGLLVLDFRTPPPTERGEYLRVDREIDKSGGYSRTRRRTTNQGESTRTTDGTLFPPTTTGGPTTVVQAPATGKPGSPPTDPDGGGGADSG